MDYQFREDDQKFFDRLEAIVSDLAGRHGAEQANDPACAGRVRELLADLADTHYLSLGIAPGDPAEDAVKVMRAGEGLASHTPSLFLAVECGTRQVARALQVFGTEAQRTRWLPPLLQGRWIGAVALSEGAMNVVNDDFETEGVRDGNTVVLNGVKHFVVNGPIADLVAVAGRLENRSALFLVEPGDPGFHAGDRVPTLGFDGTAFGTVELDACRVSEDRIIGPMDRDRLVSVLRQWEDLALTAAALGLMHASLETARAYAKLHVTGGKPLVAYQEIAFKLAEMLAAYQAAQLLAYRAAWSTAAQPREAPALVSCAKVFCGETAEQVASAALQVLSGTGFTAENAAERAYRAARYVQIAGTSNELSRMRIADLVLRKRR